MENLITEELLSKVLKVNIRKINNSILDGNLYYYKTFVNCKSKINIYELAYKCESHFMLLGFQIKSWFNEIDSFIEIYYLDNLVFKQQYQCPKVEAIFKACEHIRRELLK